MKVALVSKAIYPTRGGVELHVHNLAHELARLGHDVQVFTADGPRRSSRPNGYGLSSGMSNFGLGCALNQGGFDVVHIHGARTMVAAWALLAASAFGLRTVFTPHCFYPPQDWIGVCKRQIFDPTIGKLSLRRADRIICLTENDRNDAIQNGAAPEKIHIIPNAIRWPQPVDEIEAENFRQRFGLGKFLLSVGRLDRVKQGDFLISALPHLPQDIQLVFIGPDAGCGRLWRNLAQHVGVSTRTRFIAEVSDTDLQLAYRASTAVVMASSYEGLPTVLLEAMAVGVPVIAADAGGIGCLLQHEENGLLYPAKDISAFCANIQRCLKKFPGEMVRSAQNKVHEHYCWETNAARIAALYQND